MSGGGGYLGALGLLLAVGLPLVLATALAVPAWRGLVLRLAPWAALPALVLAALGPSGAEAALPWLLLGSRLALDETGRVFLLLTGFLWLLAGLYAGRYYAGREDRARFFVFFLLSLAGNLGVVLAADALSFFAAYALMGLASFGLVLGSGGKRARHAAAVYLVLVVLGEVLLFSALVAMAREAGSFALPLGEVAALSGATLALLVAGLGIKSGLVPLHVSLPLIYPAAPTPAAVALAGAMVNAGLLGWLRLLPLGEAALPGWGALLIVLGLLGALYGVVVGLVQVRPKAALAYSSVSQMGLLTLLVGVGLLAPGAWASVSAAVLLYAFHHALAKGSLFLGVGVAEADDGRRRALVLAGLLLPAAALAGLPWTSGALAKAALKGSVAALPEPWLGGLSLALPWTAVGTTLLMARFLWLVYASPPGEGARARGVWVLWAVLLVAVAGATWLLPSAREAGEAAQTMLWPTLWPVLLGALAAVVAAAWLGPWLRRLEGRVPPGDLLVPVEGLLRRSWLRLLPLLANPGPGWPEWGGWSRLLRAAQGGEGALRLWARASGLFVVLVLLFLLALALQL